MKLVLVLPILAITLPATLTRGSTPLVYDTDGNALSTDSQYHVVPADHKSTAGGGLRAYQGGIDRCPLFVAQGRDENAIDLVKFTPRDNNSAAGKAVHLSSDITISFSNLATFCMPSTSWFVANHSPTMSLSSGVPRQHVAVGTPTARVDSPSADLFRIEEHSSGETKGYKLVSSAGKGQNRGLGLYASSIPKQDRSWMAVSDSPLVVVFRKGQAKVHA